MFIHVKYGKGKGGMDEKGSVWDIFQTMSFVLLSHSIPNAKVSKIS